MRAGDESLSGRGVTHGGRLRAAAVAPVHGDDVRIQGALVVEAHRRDLELADRWFLKYGEAAVLISRMLPVVRTFISLPAGIARMNFPRFVIFTFIGALPWCYLLAYIGLKMGERWDELRDYFHGLDIVIGLVLAAGLFYFLWSHWPRAKAQVE